MIIASKSVQTRIDDYEIIKNKLQESHTTQGLLEVNISTIENELIKLQTEVDVLRDANRATLGLVRVSH